MTSQQHQRVLSFTLTDTEYETTFFLLPPNMPPILHPRSRSTSSLFAATMLASVVIVGLPHVFPCPAPRRTLADSDMIMTADGQQIERPRRRRRKQIPDEDARSNTGVAHKGLPRSTDEEVSTFLQMEAEAESMAKLGRECPVPKPGGIVGELLGFSNKKRDTTPTDLSKSDIVTESQQR